MLFPSTCSAGRPHSASYGCQAKTTEVSSYLMSIDERESLKVLFRISFSLFNWILYNHLSHYYGLGFKLLWLLPNCSATTTLMFGLSAKTFRVKKYWKSSLSHNTTCSIKMSDHQTLWKCVHCLLIDAWRPASTLSNRSSLRHCAWDGMRCRDWCCHRSTQCSHLFCIVFCYTVQVEHKINVGSPGARLDNELRLNEWERWTKLDECVKTTNEDECTYHYCLLGAISCLSL